MKCLKLSILIPAYNEEKTICDILNRIKNVQLIHNIQKEIIVVNDNSTDNTEQVLKEYMVNNPGMDIVYHKHPENCGKGAALHTAIGLAGGDYIVIQDADLEYDPEEYNDLLKPVFKAGADVVYGSRFNNSNPHRILFYWHSIGNRLLTRFSNIFSGFNLSDMETCFKLFRADILKSISLKEKRFGFEPEITAKLSRIEGLKLYEVGISYYGRTYIEGKKINWKDGFRALYCIIKYGMLKLQ